MTAAAGPDLDPPTDPDVSSPVRRVLGDALAITIVLVTPVLGLLVGLLGFMGSAFSDGKEGWTEVTVGVLVLAVSAVVAVQLVRAACGAPRAHTVLGIGAAAAGGLVALVALTHLEDGRGVAVAGLVAGTLLGIAGAAVHLLTVPATGPRRRLGVGALVAVVLVHVFVVVRLLNVPEIFARSTVGATPVFVPVSGAAFIVLYVVVPVVGMVAALRGVRWAFLLVMVPCAVQVLMLTFAGPGTDVVRIVLALVTAAAALFLRPPATSS